MRYATIQFLLAITIAGFVSGLCLPSSRQDGDLVKLQAAFDLLTQDPIFSQDVFVAQQQFL